jgi:hypothetical protein
MRRSGVLGAMTPKNGQFACIPARAAGDRKLGEQDFRVLTAIAMHADGSGIAYPSLGRIALLAGIPQRSNVCRSITQLEKAGYLRHERHKGATGAWAHSVYEIIFQDAEAVPDEVEQSSAPATDQVIEQKGEAARAIAEGMLEVWRTECGDVLPVPHALERDRVVACQTRFRDSFKRDIEKWRALCREIRQSSFCCGDGPRGWRADFDWALKPNSIRGVLEGKYRDNRPLSRSRGTGTYDGIPPLGPGGT